MLVRRVTALSSLVLAFGLALPVATTAPARASTTPAYAPLDRPGPKLSVDPASLKASLACHGDPRTGGEPVLLNPGTSVTPYQNFSWNYEKAFTAQKRYWCAVTMPHHTFGDIQTAGEYLVHAIRTMHARTGRRIGILGHSQGGMSMRWALRFWPDTRPMVDDVIGMAADNHGTTAIPGCIKGVTTCVPAVWQQLRGSAFMRALNSRTETFRSISYTEIYSHTDEVVTPSDNNTTASSALHTGDGRVTNIAIQDVCPADLDEHLLVGTVSATTYALVMDALTHRGPAAPSRIDTGSVCAHLYMPYVDPATLDTYLPMVSAIPNLVSTVLPLVTFSGAPMLKAEPALRCYTRSTGC